MRTIVPLQALARYWVLLGTLAMLVMLVTWAFGGTLFPYSQLATARTWLTLFCIFHAFGLLFLSGRPHEIVALIATPFLTQLYQVGLGRDFEAGATSLMRLVPYFPLLLAFVWGATSRGYRPTRIEFTVWLVISTIAVSAAILAYPYTVAGVTIAAFIVLLLPAFHAYLTALETRAPERIEEVHAALTVGVLLLTFGFFAAFLAGFSVETARGIGDLESAREIGDFNSLISYLLLAWPFAFLYCLRRSSLLAMAMTALLCIVILVGLSKTMLVLGPILVLASVVYAVRQSSIKHRVYSLAFIGAMCVLAVVLLPQLPAVQFILDIWFGRLDLGGASGGTVSLGAIFDAMSQSSEAWADRSLLHESSFAIIASHPWLGTGWATFPFLSAVQQGTAHSLTLDLLQQAGPAAALLFWLLALEILARLVLSSERDGRTTVVPRLYLIAFVLWIIAAHSLGAELVHAADSGFAVNATTGMMFLLYLRRRILIGVELSPETRH